MISDSFRYIYNKLIIIEFWNLKSNTSKRETKFDLYNDKKWILMLLEDKRIKITSNVVKDKLNLVNKIFFALLNKFNV